jgi:hypothetical protein
MVSAHDLHQLGVKRMPGKLPNKARHRIAAQWRFRKSRMASVGRLAVRLGVRRLMKS